MVKIIDGAAMAKEIRRLVKSTVHDIETKYQVARTPNLHIITTTDDPASAVYVNHKIKDCSECGISVVVHRFINATGHDVIRMIEGLNKDTEVDGIIVQLPLDPNLEDNRRSIMNAISPRMDVDGLCSTNVGWLTCIGSWHLKTYHMPCTPRGIMVMLQSLGVTDGFRISGTKSVVIGRSDIVGRPMARLLESEGSTVTVCHSRTPSISDYTYDADIIVSATGVPGIVTGDMVKDGAVVIDVGITRMANGKLVGDVDFESVEPIAGYITPVPGGVGPMTRAMLLVSVCEAAGGMVPGIYPLKVV